MGAKHGFLLYIEKNADRDDPIGDYCSDTLRAIKIYPDILLKKKSDFIALMNKFLSCEEAFKDAWRQYQNER